MAKHPGGRPTGYNDEIVKIICERIANGESVRTICSEDAMPAEASVYKWLLEHKEFSEKYAHARERQADFYAHQCLQISDDGLNDTYVDENGNKRTDHDVVARSRLRVDTRKWYASKLAPKKYGDRQIVEGPGDKGEHTHKVDVTLTPEDAYLTMIGKK